MCLVGSRALLEGWSVKRLSEAGANAVKLLLYFSSRSSAEINRAKYSFVEKVGRNVLPPMSRFSWNS